MPFPTRLPATVILLVAGLATAAEPAQNLSLERAVELGRARSVGARQAGASADAAEARRRQARAFFFPDLTLSAVYTRRPDEVTRTVGGETVVVQSQNAFSVTAQASLTLFDARSFPLYRQAVAARDAAELDADEAERLAGFEAADAFLQTIGQEEVARAAVRRVAFARERLADAKARADAKLASSNDVTRAELEVAAAERARVAAEGSLADAYLRLGDFIGQEVQGPLGAPTPILDAARREVPAGKADALWARARRDRLDLRASERRIDAAREAASVPARGFWPTLGVLGQARSTNESGLSGNDVDWFVSLTATWNIWDGGTRAAQSDEAEANLAFAEVGREGQERAARLALGRALSSLATAQAAFGHAGAEVELARKNAGELQILYAQGLARALEVADAGQAVFDAEVALAQAGYGLAVAYLGVRSALGLPPVGAEVQW